MNQRFTIAFCLSVIVLFASCAVTKKTVYFRDLDTIKVSSIRSPAFKEPVIQPDDILSINIQTIDPKNALVLNQATTMSAVGASSASAIGNQAISGFLVDKEGMVELPMLGKMKVSGLTTYHARELIRDKVSFYYKDPTVQVRFANYKITIIGEVAKPATYTVPNEKVSVLDALGLAGDLTIYGKRENVLLIRETADEKHFVRLNLNSSKLFESPYYYLRQNDVLYVEPNKAKVASNNAARTQTLTLLGSAMSVLIILLTRV